MKFSSRIVKSVEMDSMSNFHCRSNAGIYWTLDIGRWALDIDRPFPMIIY